MDEMKEYEVRTILDNLQYVDRPAWEQTRLNVYARAQMNTKKKLKVSDIMTFPWESNNNHEEHIIEISNEDIERLKEKAKKISKNLNGTI